jgi:hypothetical protein
VESSKNRFIFHHDGHFLALQMVNFSSLHDEGGPADVFYHHRRVTLVNALQMGLSSSFWVNTLRLFAETCLGGKPRADFIVPF